MPNTVDHSTDNDQLNIPAFLLTPVPQRVPTSDELENHGNTRNARRKPRKKSRASTSRPRTKPSVGQAEEKTPSIFEPSEDATPTTVEATALDTEDELEPVADQVAADEVDAESVEQESDLAVDGTSKPEETAENISAEPEQASSLDETLDDDATDTTPQVDDMTDAQPASRPEDESDSQDEEDAEDTDDTLSVKSEAKIAPAGNELTAESETAPEADDDRPSDEDEIEAMMRSVMQAIRASKAGISEPVAAPPLARALESLKADILAGESTDEPDLDEPLDEESEAPRSTFTAPSLAQLGIILPQIESDAVSKDATASTEDEAEDSRDEGLKHDAAPTEDTQEAEQTPQTAPEPLPEPEPEPEPPSLEEDIETLEYVERHLFANRYASSELESFGTTIDPPDAIDDRTEALAVLAEERNDLLCKPDVGTALERLAERSDDLDPIMAAQVKVLARDRHRLISVPAPMQARFVHLVSDAHVAWKHAREHDEWRLFAPYLDRLVKFKRKAAHAINPDAHPYDVMLEEFEPGTDRALYDSFFGHVQKAVMPLFDSIASSKRTLSRACVEGRFDERRQWDLAYDLCDLLGIRMDAHFLTSTIHPFSEAMSSHYVVTAHHVEPTDLMSGVYSMLHELGHGLYEQGVNPDFNRTSLKGGTSCCMHEAQARLFENYIGRDQAFIVPLLELLRYRFPGQLGRATPNQLYRAVNQVNPSAIRADADEVSYPLHIIIRYELEKMLFEGTATARDIPQLWAERYESYLGVRPSNNVEGALQDIHWAMGEFGYFPSYALGTAYAAQLRAQMLEDGINWQRTLRSGDLQPIKAWLGEHIWQHGRTLDSATLIQNACGKPFDATYYTEYLTGKYSALYNLRWD